MLNPGMWLEIRKGKTNFPLRPISGERFLIGAGSHCHLQLGGDHVPMLHSLLVIEGRTAHLEAVVAEPPLLVNDEARQIVELQDEDVVSIGDFEFVFHRLASSEPHTQACVSVRAVHDEISGVADLSQLSVSELVGLIEEEAEQIATFSRSREQGAAALIDAARRSAPPHDQVSVPLAAYRKETSHITRTEQWPAQYEALLQRQVELRIAQEQLAAQLAAMTKQLALNPMWENQPPRRARA